MLSKKMTMKKERDFEVAMEHKTNFEYRQLIYFRQSSFVCFKKCLLFLKMLFIFLLTQPSSKIFIKSTMMQMRNFFIRFSYI